MDLHFIIHFWNTNSSIIFSFNFLHVLFLEIYFLDEQSKFCGCSVLLKQKG